MQLLSRRNVMFAAIIAGARTAFGFAPKPAQERLATPYTREDFFRDAGLPNGFTQVFPAPPTDCVCGSCRGGKCVDAPSPAEPLILACTHCGGDDEACPTCKGTGQEEITTCPRTFIEGRWSVAPAQWTPGEKQWCIRGPNHYLSR